MPNRGQERTPASFLIIDILNDASSDSSASPRDLSPLSSGISEIVTVQSSPTTDQDVPDEAPDS